MPGLLGQTKELSNVSGNTKGVYDNLLAYIGQHGFDQLNPGTSVDTKSVQPYLDLFSQQNSRNFAQAKESAGTLTGSGLGSIIGQEAGRADTEQGAFLANLFENRRNQDANRYQSLILSALGSPAGGVQHVYQPGLLDYAAQGAGAIASGGAFNGLFPKGG